MPIIFNKFQFSIFLWICFSTIFLTAGGVVLFGPKEIDAPQKLAATTEPVFESVPQLVAHQFKTGDYSCPTADPLTYEACLIYQSALGIWENIGLTTVCPDVAKDVPSPFKKSNLAKPTLTAHDALRAPQTPCFSYLYAIGVANTTPILISTANRVFQKASGAPFSKPQSDPNLCIQARHGICGNHAAVGLALFEKAGMTSRPVEFYHEKQGKRLSHIIPEVLIDKEWRPIDTTYGAYWVENDAGNAFTLSSLDALLTEKEGEAKNTLFYNNALLPYGLYETLGQTNFFDYLNSNSDIIRGGNGVIEIAIHGSKGLETFRHKPNFLGDNLADNDRRGLSFNLASNTGQYFIKLNVSGAAVGGEAPVSVCIDETCLEFLSDKKEYEFLISNPSQLHLHSDNDVAYLVLSSIAWERKI
jgi:hypothetical protein